MRNRTLVAFLSAVGLLPFAGPLAGQVWEVNDHLLTVHTIQEGARFGYAVALGDFNGDGYGDVVGGAPYWISPDTVSAGAWVVYLGGPGRSMTRLDRYYVPGDVPNLSGWALAAGDFDNDGRDEIAIGQPGAEVGGDAAAGAVTIFQFQPPGSWSTGQTLTQSVTTGSTAEPDDQFGYRLTVGNFNCDDYEDLAVGVPREDLPGDVEVGIVHVFYGGAAGLRTDNDDARWAVTTHQDEQYGYALAAGDYNGDECDDLAVGAPFRIVSGQVNAGGVEIHFGSASGLKDDPPQLITDVTFGGAANANDFFGWSLAAANFNQAPYVCFMEQVSCYDDLAIGVPGQKITNDEAGKVMVAYGGSGGIRADNETYLQPSSVGAWPELGDWFGCSLAAGDLDQSGSSSTRFADLAIGTIYEDYHATNDGYVHLVFGAEPGVDEVKQEQPLDLKPAFNLDPAADNDYWGWSLAIGDLDNDGWGDLVVGVPYKDRAGAANVGVVEVLYGALFADGFESQATVNW